MNVMMPRSSSGDTNVVQLGFTYFGRALEANRRRNKRSQLSRVAITSKLDVVVEVAIDPIQSSRNPAKSGELYKLSLQPFTAQIEILASLVPLTLLE